MGDFFHGWRRKTGCVTLVAALMLLGGWLKSLRSFDEINCPLGNDYTLAMTSWKDALAIRISWAESPWTDFYWMERDEDYCGYADPKSPRYRFEQPIPDGVGDCVTWTLLDWVRYRILATRKAIVLQNAVYHFTLLADCHHIDNLGGRSATDQAP